MKFRSQYFILGILAIFLLLNPPNKNELEPPIPPITPKNPGSNRLSVASTFDPETLKKTLSGSQAKMKTEPKSSKRVKGPLFRYVFLKFQEQS